MSATISSINYCPVKSVSFQKIDKSEIKKDIGIVGDRVFAFAKDLDLDKVKLITALIFLNMSPLHEREFGDMLFFKSKQMLQEINDK